LKKEFDSTYPVHLNGIISPDEFRESINRINRTIISDKSLIIFTTVFTLSILGGTICYTFAGIEVVSSPPYVYVTLFIVGTVLSIFLPIFFGIRYCITQSQRAARTRKVIAEESMKYSSRSPIPCSWRLDTENHGGALSYHVSFIVL
jgi:hypothetical protein